MEIEPRTVNFDGVELTLFGRPNDLYFHSVCVSPHYDDHLISVTANSLRDGDVLLDVGGNIGYFSIATATRCRRRGLDGVRLFAFEPGRINYEAFERALDANPAVAENVSLQRFGLSSTDTEAELSYAEANTAGAHLFGENNPHYPCSEVVKLRRLHAAMGELGVDRIDFIKVDIEGHEQALLGAIADLIAEYRPTLLVEVNGWVIDILARTATSVFVDFLLDLAPFAYGVHADRTFMDVRADRTAYLRANLLAKTHQDVLLGFDPARMASALEGFRQVH